MSDKNLEIKSKIAVERHLKNIKSFKKNLKLSPEEISKMYDYLNYCWICGKRFNFWDSISFNIQHGFGGNLHRRNCQESLEERC